MKARIVRYSFIGVVAVLIILCGMKFSNIYKDYQKLQFNQEQIDTQVSETGCFRSSLYCHRSGSRELRRTPVSDTSKT